MNWIQAQFEKWPSLKQSWIGRISVVKMKILPKLLFIFQNVANFISVEVFK